ncbi:hypothetical protein [Arthrobacter sp. UYEF20]|uniref:hypothetical protein n=1 Tax=Arthrobacter sp. UYEF20 TaxID=1756363 RepID=UPI003391A39A
MAQTEEYQTVTIPAGKKAQTKALNKLARDGWILVDKKHLWGAGVDTVTMKRTYVAPAPQFSLMTWLMRKLTR